MAGLLAFVAGGLLEGAGKGLAADGLAKRKAALKKLENDLAQQRTLELEAVKQKNRKSLKTEDRAAQQTNALALKAAPGASTLPTGYQRTDGGLEFIPGGPSDPSQARLLAEAKRDPDGDTTPAQQANNAEIDAARQVLDGMNLDRAEILRRIQKATNTGRENPDYDPSLERLVRTATQRKVGKDLKFNLIHRRYLGPPPEFSDPAGPKALPPGVSAEKPGFIDRARDFLGFGGDDKPAPASDAGARRRRTGRGGRGGTRGRSGTGDIGAMSLAELDNLINARGDSLSPEDLRAIEARLAEIGL